MSLSRAGRKVEQALFHVVLDGRRVGPYDRRTVVGMRIKKALSNDHVLIDKDGIELTVGDLIAHRPRQNFSPHRTGSFSIVQATYTASLVAVEPGPFKMPAFRGEVEARVQGEVLRIAGRFRQGLAWKEDRVKLPLRQVVHARVMGSQVELWLGSPGPETLQRIALELFTPEAAGELVEWLPAATPWPANRPVAPMRSAANPMLLWASLAGLVMVAVVLVVALGVRR